MVFGVFKFSWEHEDPTCRVIIMRTTMLLSCINILAASAVDVWIRAWYPNFRGVVSSAAATLRHIRLPTKYGSNNSWGSQSGDRVWTLGYFLIKLFQSLRFQMEPGYSLGSSRHPPIPPPTTFATNV